MSKAKAIPPHRSSASAFQFVVRRDVRPWLLTTKRGLGFREVIGDLEVDEVARVEFEETTKANGGVRRYGAASCEDFAEAALGDARGFRGGKPGGAGGSKHSSRKMTPGCVCDAHRVDDMECLRDRCHARCAGVFI